MSKQTCKVIEAKDVDEALLRQMFRLMEETYSGTSLEKIKKDLGNKHYVLLLTDETGAAQGFTTMQILDSRFRGRPVKVIYSGDTIISEKSRGEIELMRSWWRFSYAVQQKYPEYPVYWMLISKGWRTYKFFPLFLKEFYPDKSRKTPEDYQDFIDRLGKFKFPGEYADGLVVPKEPDYLKTASTDVPNHRTDDQDVSFFLSKNPDFIHGSELVCVAELRPDNLTKAGLRLLHGQRS